MAALTQYVFHFGQPWWLLAALAAVPMIALAWRNLSTFGRGRQVLAIIFRALVMLLLAAALARPMLTDKNQQLTLIAVIDRSMSVPQDVQEKLLLGRADSPEFKPYLPSALLQKPKDDRLAVIDVAERAYISQLPSGYTEVKKRSTDLSGSESRLSSGVELAMAIAPPDTSVRMLLVSDGNETSGDLREAARVAAANGIPIDVLPLTYDYRKEVVFKSIVAPVKGRSGQTVPLRMVLNLSGNEEAFGKLLLTMNGRPVPLGGASGEVGLDVKLKPGINVQTVSVPLGSRGMHEFRATFLPADPSQDSLEPNNHASAITFVAGPGHVLVIDEDTKSGEAIVKALQAGRRSASDGAPFDVRHVTPNEFPTKAADLADCDAIVLANVDCGAFSLEQQEMLVHYVGEMGGGLVMSGGPNSFGAGGWIGSPVANIMPVDMDPPQKKQMPKGALVLLMHACEVSQGNYWSKQVAQAAVGTLSRLDLAGILEYGMTGNGNHWIYPLQEVGDKKAINAALKNMQMGDMPDFGAPMQEAYDELKKARAGQRHVIIISDGDPAAPSAKLLKAYRDSGISVTTVAIGIHSQPVTMQMIAQQTGGNFYDVQDPKKLPQIFIKEAQIVRRALIVEEKVKLKITSSVNEIIRGVTAAPTLDGYVLTGPKGGLNQLVLASDPGGDPILAAGQHGLGRTVAFTSSADSRWAPSWLAWGGFNRFWEQVIRYVGKSSQAGDLEVFADVQGRAVTLTVESVDSEGKFVQFSQLAGHVISPDMKKTDLSLTQVGPGRYRANFLADGGGCYLVTLQYKPPGEGTRVSLMHSAVIVPYAPEYRDLTHNAAVLAEVAHTTGGRVISSPPERAELFSRQGVRIPQTAMPLTGPLMMIWLGVFLLDVAARRIAVDFAAVWRRMKSAVPRLGRRRKTRDATIDRLKNKRQEYLEGLAKKKAAVPTQSPAAVASRRYEAAPDASGAMDTSAMRESVPAAPAGPAPQKKEEPKPVDRGSLDKLLDAKRRAKDKLR